jgi:hypothetical protein
MLLPNPDSHGGDMQWDVREFPLPATFPLTAPCVSLGLHHTENSPGAVDTSQR